MSPATTQIVETIDSRLAAAKSEEARLIAARRALTGRSPVSATVRPRQRTTNGRTHKQNVAKALREIHKHPGRPAKEMKLAPVAVSALSRSGQIVREGEGWKVAT